jgi:SAM-dependent methyltransferase
MARWDHGYVTDVAYTAGAHQETTPAWLAACCVLLGYRPPDLAASFRYADIGCGNGFNALIAAAVNPNAEVWGFDFNPTHIESARALAAQAGLANARFAEVSFETLAKAEDGLSGSFDFVVSHGVLSWISLENRGHLTRIIERLLRPGGLAYLSYNTAPGWLGIEPVRRLMRQLAETSQRRTDLAVADIFQVLDQLKSGGAGIFQTNPGLDARLEQMKSQDARYIAHEFLNRDWHPLMFADVEEAMRETRTSYIGSATPMENIDAAAVPPNLQLLLANTLDAGIRETIRDLASAKAFRRDLWRKGGEPLPAPEHAAMLDAMTLIWTGKPIDGPITFPGPIGSVTGQTEFYRPIVDALTRAPATIGELRALPGFQGRSISEFAQAAFLMIGAGYAHPACPASTRTSARETAARLNAAIIGRLKVGVDLQRLAAPLIGSSVSIGVLEGLVAGHLLDGSAHEPERLIDAVYNDVIRSGRSLLRDGQAMRDSSEGRILTAGAVREALANRLPLLRAVGIID